MEQEDKLHTDIPDESLLIRYINEEITDNEKVWIESWIEEDTDNEKILTQLALLYHAYKTQERIKYRDAHTPFQKVQDKIRAKSRRIFLRRIAVVASLIFGLAGLGALLAQFLNLKEQHAPSMITIHSNNNSRSQFTLPDGTEVYLNSRTTLIYPSYYQGNERKVTLKEGEAYFKVAHNADRPFIVNVADSKYNIKVLGTEFNLQAYEEDKIIQTTLVKGSVLINIEGKEAKTTLKPSQKAVYSLHSNQLEIFTANTDRETDWIYDRLVFRQTPIKEVLDCLSRFYDVEFDVKNDIIYKYTFTGTFENKPLFQVLDYMKISSNITYIITYKKDENGTKSVVELRSR